MAILWMVNSSELPLMLKKVAENEKQIPQDWATQDFLSDQRPVMRHGFELLAIGIGVAAVLALAIVCVVIIVQAFG